MIVLWKEGAIDAAEQTGSQRVGRSSTREGWVSQVAQPRQLRVRPGDSTANRSRNRTYWFAENECNARRGPGALEIPYPNL